MCVCVLMCVCVGVCVSMLCQSICEEWYCVHHCWLIKWKHERCVWRHGMCHYLPDWHGWCTPDPHCVDHGLGLIWRLAQGVISEPLGRPSVTSRPPWYRITDLTGMRCPTSQRTACCLLSRLVHVFLFWLWRFNWQVLFFPRDHINYIHVFPHRCLHPLLLDV